MGGTSMQLVEVNQNTLIQWYKQQTEKSRSCLCCFRAFSCLSPSLKLRNLSRLPNAQGLSQKQPAEQHQYKLPESTAGQAKQRQTSTGRPPLRPKAPAQSPMLVTPSATWSISADGTQHTYTSSTRFPGCADASGVCQCSRVCKWFKTANGPGNANGSGLADASGNPDVQGMSMIQPQFTAYSSAGHSLQPAASPQAMPRDPTREL